MSAEAGACLSRPQVRTLHTEFEGEAGEPQALHIIPTQPASHSAGRFPRGSEMLA